MVWKLDHLLDYHDDGRLTRNQYVTELKDLVARHPGFIDGHAPLAFALLEQDKPKLALGAGLRGLALGEEAIPADFKGKTEWGFLENRPFLRAAHGVVLGHLRFGQRLKAIPLMEKMLAWNPNDNQGISSSLDPTICVPAWKIRRQRSPCRRPALPALSI